MTGSRESCTVTFVRPTRWVSHFRSYALWIDEEKVGKIKDGETWSTEVEPGRHSVRCTLDWGRSERLQLSLDAGESVQIRIVSTDNPFDVLLGRDLLLETVRCD